jgi:succinyldiaminopimelate transaminase
MARAAVEGGFVPPPYPHDRLGDLQEIAAAAPGGLVDASVGTPVDPTPDFVLEAARKALGEATGYPASIGYPALREAAAGWIQRRFGVGIGADSVTACIGTKEAVASLPRVLSLRDPSRDTVLYPALAYPTYAMGATLAGLRAVPVPVDERWVPDVRAVDPDDVARALLLWCNDPANPTGVAASPGGLSDTVAWARAAGIVVASDECYAEFTYDENGASADPVTALAGDVDGVLAVHSLSKRSNMAGFRVGFLAGDGDLVRYLGEVRKHAGMMIPSPMQAAGIAALGDDRHVEEQRCRYADRRTRLVEVFARVGIVHDGGPSAFYLWLRDRDADTEAWALATRLARAGVIVAPGDLYGPDGAHHVRLALTLTDDQVERVADNVVKLGEGT